MAGTASLAYDLRRLGPQDADAVQVLFERNPDYFELVFGHPAGPGNARSLFEQLPESASPESKMNFGIYTEGALAGVVDLIRDWPEPAVWFLGLLLIDRPLRHQGLGRRVMDELVRKARGEGAREIQISVVADNLSALRFWQAYGFVEFRRATTDEHGELAELIYLKLPLRDS